MLKALWGEPDQLMLILTFAGLYEVAEVPVHVGIKSKYCPANLP